MRRGERSGNLRRWGRGVQGGGRRGYGQAGPVMDWLQGSLRGYFIGGRGRDRGDGGVRSEQRGQS